MKVNSILVIVAITIAILFFPILNYAVESHVDSNLELRKSLQLNTTNPSYWQFFTSSYVHVDHDHFIGNIWGYFIFVIYGLSLALVLDKIKDYLLLMIIGGISFGLLSTVVFFSVFTILDSPKMSCGFSGINAVFLGLILILWLMFFAKHNNQKYSYYFDLIGIIMIIIAFGIFLRYLSFEKSNLFYTIAFILIILSALAFLLMHYCIRCMEFVSSLMNLFKTSKIVFLYLFFIIFVLIFGISSSFPSIISTDSGTIDIFTHYFGFFYGICLGFYYFQ